MQTNVIDKSGKWIKNTSMFRMVDPVTQVIHEPGAATKVAFNEKAPKDGEADEFGWLRANTNKDQGGALQLLDYDPTDDKAVAKAEAKAAGEKDIPGSGTGAGEQK